MLGSFRSGLNLSSGVDGARYGIHVPCCVSYCDVGAGFFGVGTVSLKAFALAQAPTEGAMSAAACGRASWALVRWEPKDQGGGTEEKK